MKEFNKDALLEAFDVIGTAAVENNTKLELAIYGGSAMMLASNFRFATEDVDIAEIIKPWPHWFEQAVMNIAAKNNWNDDWLNDAVQFHLSPLASKAYDHIEYGSFPKNGKSGLNIIVPTAEYMLALKLKAARFLDPVKGPQESDDVYQLMRVLGIESTPDGIEKAISILAKYFPKSGQDASKQRFLIKNIKPSFKAGEINAPNYGR